MSHYYGTISQSSRKTPATARGTKTTGLTVQASTYEGAIEVQLKRTPDGRADMFHVERIDADGNRKTLARDVL